MLTDIKSHTTSYITFGDGAKGEIKGVGKLECSGVPKLDDVLHVKGLTTNLISISQLYDQGFKVNFTKEECLICNEKNEVIMKGIRSKDNYYLWVPQELNLSSTCALSIENEVKLWHQKLRNLNLKGMKIIISEEVVKGIPKLKIEEGRVYSDCQIGKQTKMSHQKMQHLTTSKVLELLHMDMMVPMLVESLGVKKYAYVVVDDFSRYTWISFIREKSENFEVFKDLCQKL